jgi:membrane protease YdiL (CAAX protease family)
MRVPAAAELIACGVRDAAARNAFHVGLATIALPAFGLALAAASWWALRDVRSDAGLRWRSRLGRLIALDAYLFLALVGALLLRPDSGPLVAASAARPQPRIGVELELQLPPVGVRIRSVLAGSPAARAGLRGRDVILAVDGGRVSSNEQLAALIGAGHPGAERELGVSRGGKAFPVTVTPQLDLAPPPLWNVHTTAGCEASTTPLLWLALALATTAAWLYAWRRRRLLLASVLAVGCALACSAVVERSVAWALCERFGGFARGHGLLVLSAFELAHVAAALLLFLALRSAGLTTPTLGRSAFGPAVGLGLLYCLAIQLRWAIAFVTVCTWLDWTPLPNAVQSLPLLAASPIERAWLLVLVAVAAPVAEELVFRGILLPGLCLRMSPQRALLLSSVLFGAMHIDGQGVHAIAIGGIGWVFGFIRLHSGDLRACTLVHMAFNGGGLLLLWLRG